MNTKYYLKTTRFLDGILAVLHTHLQNKAPVLILMHWVESWYPLTIQNSLKKNVNSKNQMQRVNALQCKWQFNSSMFHFTRAEVRNVSLLNCFLLLDMSLFYLPMWEQQTKTPEHFLLQLNH